MNGQAVGVVLVELFLLAAGSQAAVIDVMVVYEGTAFANTSAANRLDDGSRIISTANVALAESGLNPPHAFNLVYVHTSAVNFSSTPTTTRDQVLDVISGTPLSDPVINSLRDQYAADLVVLVSQYGADFCGAARVAEDMYVRKANQDLFFFTALVRECFQPGFLIGAITAPHEFGHLLSLEHEKGTAAGEDDKGSKPVSYNHPDKTGTFATLMVSGVQACAPLGNCNVGPFFSDPGRNYPGQTFPRGHAYDRHDARMMNDAFPIIADYRPLPGQQVALLPPSCALEFVGCSGSKRRYLVSWYQNDAQPFPVADADYSTNGGTTWYDLYGGLDACMPIVPSIRWDVRARIRSAWGDSGYCTIRIQPGACSGEDP